MKSPRIKRRYHAGLGGWMYLVVALFRLMGYAEATRLFPHKY